MYNTTTITPIEDSIIETDGLKINGTQDDASNNNVVITEYHEIAPENVAEVVITDVTTSGDTKVSDSGGEEFILTNPIKISGVDIICDYPYLIFLPTKDLYNGVTVFQTRCNKYVFEWFKDPSANKLHNWQIKEIDCKGKNTCFGKEVWKSFDRSVLPIGSSKWIVAEDGKFVIAKADITVEEIIGGDIPDDAKPIESSICTCENAAMGVCGLIMFPLLLGVMCKTIDEKACNGCCWTLVLRPGVDYIPIAGPYIGMGLDCCCMVNDASQKYSLPLKRGIACPLNNSTATHVIQYGSWDLRAASVRYVMRNYNFIPAIINAIRNLIEKKGCYMKVRIVLVLPMPYPNCPYTDYDYSKFKDMGRVTNLSIDAISQYLIQVLSKLQSKQIDIVDTRSILSSNLTAHERGSHFLCRDKDKKWRETVSGDAFVATSIHAACHQSVVLQIVKDKNVLLSQ